MILSLLVGLVLGAATLLFALQNTGVVALTFLGWQFQGSLALLVFVALGIGIAISVLAALPSTIGASFRISGLERENRKLAEELEAREQARVAAVNARNDSPQPVDLRS